MDGIDTIILTGGSGLVGKALVQVAPEIPGLNLVVVPSRARQGVDLSRDGAWRELVDSVAVDNPDSTVVIHAAALVSWEEQGALTANPAMAWNVTKWMLERRIRFGHFVSTVSAIGNPPASLYGIGKLAAEHVWAKQLGPGNFGISRLAGVLALQNPHGMFWNKVLRAARAARAGEADAEIAYNPCSSRNYVTAREAAECLLSLSVRRITGVHLVAGRDETSLAEFVEQLGELSESPLPFQRLPGESDRIIHPPSPEITSVLRPFRERINEIWKG